MRSRVRTAFHAISILIVASFAFAQGAAPPDARRAGRVLVTGENPGIRLLDKEGGTVLAHASYWRIVWSPAGAGHVCYLTTGDGKSPGDLRIALVDNQKMYEFLTREVMTTIDPTIPGRPFTAVQATFDDPGAGTFDPSGAMKERTVTIKSPKHSVALTWRDFTEPFLVDAPVGKEPNRLSLVTLFIPAKSADLVINGTKAPGQVYPARGFARSSAFLAYSESWL